jgi:hypothetical protein
LQFKAPSQEGGQKLGSAVTRVVQQANAQPSSAGELTMGKQVYAGTFSNRHANVPATPKLSDRTA